MCIRDRDKATGKSHWYYYDESGKRLSLDELKAKQSDPGNTIFEIGGQYYACLLYTSKMRYFGGKSADLSGDDSK